MSRLIIADGGNYIDCIKTEENIDDAINRVGIAKCRMFGVVYFQLTKNTVTRILQSKNIWECCMCPIIDNSGNIVNTNEYTDESYAMKLNDEINRMNREQDGLEMRVFAHMTVRWLMTSANKKWFSRDTGKLEVKAHMDKECCYIEAVSCENSKKNMINETCRAGSALGRIETIENETGRINAETYIRLSEELSKKGYAIYRVETDGEDVNIISVIGAGSKEEMAKTLEEVTLYKDFSDKVTIIGYYEDSSVYTDDYTVIE